ncbi:superoxide dismutase family protein [Streptomyces chiangmaiensis]|uniref:Superoxide dismutase family protein n=1 Tax=Streptomyces chiangmaiensis TaxID=766497 RepID=A0ABU7FTW4_9ACTN|nr:superoxide dismutase family protein [Streptomyces chiangmaiensis]MED7827350.1 superoxide dismutase family protein [Streptomyces chiangmaiensis]
MRILRKASGALAVTALLAVPTTSAFVSDDSRAVRVEGQFVPPTSPFDPSKPLTYDSKTVPVGAFISVAEQVDGRVDGAATSVRLSVSGLLPNRTYGAHVHSKPCGRTPDASGPHYQNVKDPHQPSTDPAYANRENEVWLDFRTDAQGRATAESSYDWDFRPGEAQSVVIHEHGTATKPGEAGMAGPRLACLTVPFS